MSTAKAEGMRSNLVLNIQLKWLSIWDAKPIKRLRHWLPVLFVMVVPAYVAWELQGMVFQFGETVTHWIAGYMLLTIVWQFVARKVLK